MIRSNSAAFINEDQSGKKDDLGRDYPIIVCRDCHSPPVSLG